jgi:hypothetical protein
VPEQARLKTAKATIKVIAKIRIVVSLTLEKAALF